MGDIDRKHEIAICPPTVDICMWMSICNLSIYVIVYARMTNVCTYKESHIHMLNVE